MNSYKYYTDILNESGFRPSGDIARSDFQLVHETATDQLTEYFPMSRWYEIGASSVSVRGVPYPYYDYHGIIAWIRFNDVVSDGGLFDVDAIQHESGTWQICINELDEEPDECISYAFKSEHPFFHIKNSLATGFKTEHRAVQIDHEIKEMTK